MNDFFDVYSIPRGVPPTKDVKYDMTYKNLDYVVYKILKWKQSESRKWMLCGERYFRGYHDILKKKRMTFDSDDNPVFLNEMLPNNKYVDNQYAKMVQQKVNYIFSKPLVYQTDNEQYKEQLDKIFDKDFVKMLKLLGEQSINCGIGWVHPYYDENSDLRFKIFNSWEICPFWADDTETVLSFAVRVYPFKVFEGKSEKIIERVELYTPEGVEFYILDNARLIPDVKKAYITVKTLYDSYPMSWGGQIPLIPFKSNSRSIPLIMCCKSLQDGINNTLSVFGDLLLENLDSSLLIIKGFPGDDLEKDRVRSNLLMKRTIFVDNDEHFKGDVSTLRLEVNHTNYEFFLDKLTSKLIEACKGYNIHDDRFSASSTNEMNIKTLFNDMDLDTNSLEVEYQSSFYRLLYFIDIFLKSKGLGDFTNNEVDIQFKRDTIINLETLLQTLGSLGLELPQEIMYNEVPYITDTKKALAMLKKEKEEKLNMMEKMNEAKINGASGTGINQKQMNSMQNAQRENKTEV